MRIDVLTLFPETLTPMLSSSILGRARDKGLIDVTTHQLRDYTKHRQRMTDDYPFGGGAGMVMSAQPICDAVDAIDPNARARRVYLSPRGRRLDQKLVEALAKEDRLLLLCGHYEGVDQRAIDLCGFEEISIGDYVLTGGELGALVIVDAVARLVPGVLGSDESSADDSFTTGLLEYPQYTRPSSYRGVEIPQVLLNGNHADIEAWRAEQSLALTLKRRPELIEAAPLDAARRAILARVRSGEAIVAELKARGVDAERLSLLEANAFPKRWIDAFAPKENRKAVKRACTYDKQCKYFYRAFEHGLIPVADGIAAENMAYAYVPEASALLRLDSAPQGLEEGWVYVDERWSFTMITKNGRLWTATRRED